MLPLPLELPAPAGRLTRRRRRGRSWSAVRGPDVVVVVGASVDVVVDVLLLVVVVCSTRGRASSVLELLVELVDDGRLGGGGLLELVVQHAPGERRVGRDERAGVDALRWRPP